MNPDENLSLEGFCMKQVRKVFQFPRVRVICAVHAKSDRVTLLVLQEKLLLCCRLVASCRDLASTQSIRRRNFAQRMLSHSQATLKPTGTLHALYVPQILRSFDLR